MQKPHVPVVIVAGMGRSTRAIGRENGLLWHVPDDMRRFKALTLGHPVIMGRKTFESIVDILGRPLPGRTNIVVTRNQDYTPKGALVASSIEEAFALALKENPSEIHIGGGEEIYRQALPYTDRLHVTLFDDEQIGDTEFPDYSDDFEVSMEHPPQSYKGITYQWVDLIRHSEASE